MVFCCIGQCFRNNRLGQNSHNIWDECIVRNPILLTYLLEMNWNLDLACCVFFLPNNDFFWLYTSSGFHQIHGIFSHMSLYHDFKNNQLNFMWLLIVRWRLIALEGSRGINTVSTHYNDVIMGTMASQITSLTIVYSTVYSDTDQRKHQSSASLAICAGNSPVTGEFPAQMASNAENVSIWWCHHEHLHCMLWWSVVTPFLYLKT